MTSITPETLVPQMALNLQGIDLFPNLKVPEKRDVFADGKAVDTNIPGTQVCVRAGSAGEYDLILRNDTLNVERIFPCKVSAAPSHGDPAEAVLAVARGLVRADPGVPGDIDRALGRIEESGILDARRRGSSAAITPSRTAIAVQLQHALASAGIANDDLLINGSSLARSSFHEALGDRDVFCGSFEGTVRQLGSADQWHSIGIKLCPNNRLELQLQTKDPQLSRVNPAAPGSITFGVGLAGLEQILIAAKGQTETAGVQLGLGTPPTLPSGLIGTLSVNGEVVALDNILAKSPQWSNLIFADTRFTGVYIQDPGMLFLKGNLIANELTVVGKGVLTFNCPNAKLNHCVLGQEIYILGTLGGEVSRTSILSGNAGVDAGTAANLRGLRFGTGFYDQGKLSPSRIGASIQGLRYLAEYAPEELRHPQVARSYASAEVLTTNRAREAYLTATLPQQPGNFSFLAQTLSRLANNGEIWVTTKRTDPDQQFDITIHGGANSSANQVEYGYLVADSSVHDRSRELGFEKIADTKGAAGSTPFFIEHNWQEVTGRNLLSIANDILRMPREQTPESKQAAERLKSDLKILAEKFSGHADAARLTQLADDVYRRLPNQSLRDRLVGLEATVLCDVSPMSKISTLELLANISQDISQAPSALPILETVLFGLGEVGRSTQAQHGTCGPETISYLLNINKPATYATLLADLVDQYQRGAPYRSAVGFNLPDDVLVPGAIADKRNFIDALLQAAIKNKCAEVEGKGWSYSDTKDRMHDAKGKEVQSGVTSAQAAKVMSLLFREEFVVGDLTTIARGSPQHYKALSFLKGMVSSGAMVYAALEWGDSGHAVALERVDDESKTVYFRNPWGPSEAAPGTVVGGKADRGKSPLRTIVDARIGLESMSKSLFGDLLFEVVVSKRDLERFLAS